MNVVALDKVCYLHVGLHKTASSSFQATCAKNKELLQKNGLTYPIFSCEAAKKTRIKNHSFPIKSLFTENPADFGHNKKWGVSGDIAISPDTCLLYTSPSPRDKRQSRMPSSA